MFAVIFEVRPKAEQSEAYLSQAKLLRPELERVEGFVDNIRYRSLTREGWILSLSSWRDEKSVVRWRTQMRHHVAQEKGRSQILLDYHLRVGEITADSHLPPGQILQDQRLDETEVGEGAAITLTTAAMPADSEAGSTPPPDVACHLGHVAGAEGLVAWDVFAAILSPRDAILMQTWRNASACSIHGQTKPLHPALRLRSVRIVRDYGMFDRREAPQYYPPVSSEREGEPPVL